MTTLMSMMEQEPDFDIAIEVVMKSYTIKEIKQLKVMTEEVRDHWVKMLKEAPATIGEGLKMAIGKSIEQANEDLEKIAAELASRN